MFKAVPVKYDLIKLGGGLDQVTPTLSLPSGVARRATNFECSITGGYTRIEGYERFDGRPNPSEAIYNLLLCTFVATVSVGNTLTGAISNATGAVIYVDSTSIVVTRQTGTFLSDELVRVGALDVATITAVQGVSADGLTDATYKNLAADNYRADITAVPGSGSILGVSYYNDDVYAWRNNVGATAADLYKSTSGGWTFVTFGKELSFNTGAALIADGNTVTGATSGATGVVARVVLESGTWGAGTAAGRLILSSSTGVFSSGENLTVAASVKAQAGGAATQIALLPNGRYETVIANFGGGTASYKIYGADGVNRAFEFDGTTLVPINTGMTVDTPVHITFHKQHLFLSFGGSLQFSSLSYPYQWTPLLGAGELAMNAQITNLLPLPGDQSSGALGVYTRSDTSVLYGTSSANFSLSTFNSGTGGIAYTAQNMDQAYVMDDRGVISLGTSLNFGNFLPSSLTMNLRPFIQQNRDSAIASLVNRDKGQYRIFFSNGNALYMTLLNGKLLGSMPVQYAHPVSCCVEGDTATGNTSQFFGSTNGFVYRLDAGTSFDGESIPANINLVYNATGSPRVLKRYRNASVELTGDSYTEIQFGYDLGYRTTTIDQPQDETYDNDLRSGFWDSMVWDNFVWDGSDISPSEIEVTGTAENIAVRISSNSDLFPPFTVNSIIVHYTPRRGLR
tara:strand:+ start:4184 stop:6226 length:2043 start_codon:yes stop_codon:yes gene_type:complete